MTKTSFYARYELTPDSGNVVTSWGAIQNHTGKYLVQCWDKEKTYIKKQDRTDDAVMIVKLLSPRDVAASPTGGNARARYVHAIRNGAPAFAAVSTGDYPNWIESANLEQVYPVLSVYDTPDGDTYAKAGAPVPTVEAFGS